MKYAVLGALIVLSVMANAETVPIEMDDGVKFIRCTDMFGIAKCDIIFEISTNYYDCIAFDATEAPLATGTGFGGSVMFPDLDASLIADVKCR